MPPVAFGNDTDPRRWGFQGESSADAVVGALHWPRALGLGGGTSGSAGSERQENGEAYAEASAGGRIGDVRQSIDESHLASPSFRGGADRGSPGSRAMDPRIGGDSNGNVVATAGGGGSSANGSGGPSSRQGSPFTHPFDPSSQQVQHGGSVMDVSSPALVSPYSASVPRIIPPCSGNASVAAVSGQQTMNLGRAPLPGPSRHRTIFDDGVGISPCAEHGSAQLQQGMGHEPLSQVSEVMAGGGITAGGSHAVQGGIGAGGGLAAGVNMSGMSLVPGGRMSPSIGAQLSSQQQSQQEHSHQQQQRQMRAAGTGNSSSGGGGAVLETGPGRRISAVGPWANGNSSPEDPMSMALASIPHGASSLPASAVPTVLERFPGFVRCVMDIAPEVVGWVIGRSGAHIKEMKHRSGCGMWVDQKDLKLYITGADMPRIHSAARLVGDLISKAPVNVNSAGVEDEVTSHMIECPPHLIGLLIGRGGSTIKRIKEESRANVVINQKMMKVIVSGIPQSVRLGVAMIEDVITFGRSAEHAGGIGHHPNFMDFPGSVAFGGMPTSMGGHGSVSDYDDVGSERFGIRGGGVPPMSGGGRLPHPPPPFGGPNNVGGGGGGHLLATPYSSSPYDSSPGGGGMLTQSQQPPPRRPSSEMIQGQGQGQSLHQHGMMSSGSSAGGNGNGGQPAEVRYDNKDVDWSVFSASSFSISPEGQHQQQHGAQQLTHQQQHQHSSSQHQQQQQQQHWSMGHSPSQQLPPLPLGQHQLSSSSASSGAGGGGGGGGGAARNSGVGGDNVNPSRSPALGFAGSVGGGSGGGSGTASVSSGGTPPQSGHPGVPPMMSSLGNKAVGSPAGPSVSMAAQAIARLSITSDESTTGGQSVGQANRQRERAGSPVGQPANLGEFLGDMGLGDYVQVLAENEIDLEAVQLMADSDFQDIGIPKGPRVKLLYALRTKRHPPKSGDFATMKSFLSSLGLERYSRVFEDEEVDMGAVDVMDESDYAQLGVAKGPRLKIMNFLYKSSGIATNSTGSHCGSAAGSVTGSPETRSSAHFNVAPAAGTMPSYHGSSVAAAVPRPLRTPPRPGPARVAAVFGEEASPERSSVGSLPRDGLIGPSGATIVRLGSSTGESSAMYATALGASASADSDARTLSPDDVGTDAVTARASSDASPGAVDELQTLAQGWAGVTSSGWPSSKVNGQGMDADQCNGDGSTEESANASASASASSVDTKSP